jgi:hypothetical protein
MSHGPNKLADVEVVSADRSIGWIFYVSGRYKSIATGGHKSYGVLQNCQISTSRDSLKKALQGMISKTRSGAGKEQNYRVCP